MRGPHHLVLSRHFANPAHPELVEGWVSAVLNTLRQAQGERSGCWISSVCFVGALLAIPGVVSARTTVSPYIEADQVLDADLTGDNGRDVVTYTTLAAGVDASASGRMVEGSLSYRYEHRFAEERGLGDQDANYGLLRGQVTVVPGLLTMQGGAIATRTRDDIRGAAGADAPGAANITQIYGGYLGPDLATHVGPLAVNAGYRFGYVRSEDKTNLGLPDDQPRLDQFDWSRSHTAYASVGMDTRSSLPFGWTVSGGYEHERVANLSQLTVDKYVRGDVTVPVLPTVALLGGVGYEQLRITEQTPLIDATGNFVTDDHGRYLGDPSKPRLLAYDTDGLIYDAGVMWKPSARLQLQALAVWRYHSWGATGSLKYQLTGSSGIQIGVYDQVDSFGRALTSDLVGLPTQFDVPRGGLTNRFGGCVFGQAGQGGCFNDALQSISTSNFRSRGVFALWSASRGPLRLGLGAGYTERRYVTPVFADALSLDGVKDKSWSGEGNAAYALTARTSLEGTLYVDYYEPGIAGSPNVLTGGGTASIYHNFTDHFVANASAGLYAYDQQGFDDQLEGQFQVGARYQF